MQKFIIAICLFTLLQPLSAQKMQHDKLKINLIGRDIRELAQAGIETDHGIFVKNRYFISDFSKDEIEIIKHLNFETETIVEDVGSWYANPNRSSSLQNNESKIGNCNGLLQGEYPYTTPNQYREGKMNGYFTYEEMLGILDTMALRYPHLISQRTPIGNIQTYNGRHLYFLKVSDNVELEENEPKVLYTALHHAREPNSLSQMIFYLWYLLENYEKDPLVTKIINETAMYFVPCVNPDGYIHNQTTNPNGGGLWRKNMWRDTMDVLRGVDLNRNYGYFWGVDNVGSSNNPNSPTYRGKAAFSEPETRAMRELCLQNDFKIAQNYHTFGNYLIHPWGFNDTPTNEDNLFKLMGNVMNKENKFVMGTGKETVGYIVNGVSDDWMYGAIDEKKPIYAYTPEVGPSFWPAKVDIDYLNKSCVWTNLSTAFLTLSHYVATEESATPFLTPLQNKIVINVSRAGLSNGSCVVGLYSNTSGVSVLEPAASIMLAKAGDSQSISFTISTLPDINADEINLVLRIDNEGIITEKEIIKKWVGQPFNIIYKNDIDDLTGFQPTLWALSTEQFYSPPSSMTDSPIGSYENNQFSIVTINQPINLSGAKHAVLSFYAKWDVENSFDYAQVLVSTDNLDFVPLCGKYTNIGSRFQQFGTPIYDGKQSQWIKEEISLDDYVGKQEIWIRFLIKTDEYEQRDGFYFDDLEVKASYPMATNTIELIEDVYIFPSILESTSMVFIKGLESAGTSLKFLISDISGRSVGLVPISNGSVDLSYANLGTGLYSFSILDNDKIKISGKLVVK